MASSGLSDLQAVCSLGVLPLARPALARSLPRTFFNLHPMTFNNETSGAFLPARSCTVRARLVRELDVLDNVGLRDGWSCLEASGRQADSALFPKRQEEGQSTFAMALKKSFMPSIGSCRSSPSTSVQLISFAEVSPGEQGVSFVTSCVGSSLPGTRTWQRAKNTESGVEG